MNNNNQIKVGDTVEVIECKECPRSHGEAIIITIYPRYYCVKLTKDKCLNTSHCHALIVESVSPIKKKEPKKKYQKVEFYTDNPREAIKRLYGKIEDEFSFPGKFGEIKVHDRALSKEDMIKEFAPKKEKIQKLVGYDREVAMGHAIRDYSTHEIANKLNEVIDRLNKEKDH